MKKIFSTIISLVMLASASAQTSGAVVTTIPSSFTAEDVVKIIVDVSAVGNLVGKEPLYMWTWFPSEPAPGNGQWDASDESRKMVKESANRWSVTFKPTDFYGKPPSEIPQIKFLVKAKNGNGDQKTDDIILNVDPLVYTPSVFRTFPKVVGIKEIITAYLDQNLATDLTTMRMLPDSAEVSLFNGGTQVGTTKKVALRNEGSKVWAFTFYPPSLFGVPANSVVDKIRIKYKGRGTDVNGSTIPAESPVFEKGLDDLK
ncbi:MAG TPA: hypothetical protein VK498_10750 [Ferruginibacter sp.]|nr:hypothetical protein [Ferruginibacter sp.]